MMRAPLLAAAALLCGLTEAAAPVKVFLLMGQSNMLGEGKIVGTTNGTLEFAVKTEGKYPYLWDAKTGTWATRDDVRNVFIMGNSNATTGRLFHNEFMGVNSTQKKTIGPELGIGNVIGDYEAAPVMVLKSCIGNRALGYDLLPPGSKSWDYNGTTRAGYHQYNKWPTGTTPPPIPHGAWVAGIQYDGDTARAQDIMDNLQTYYPGATEYEVAGFLWWQGDRDHYDPALTAQYEVNLVQLIKSLRKQYNAPNAKFVTASLGQTVKGSTASDGVILDAMLNVDGTSGKYPEFKGNVAAVYSHPYSMGGSSSSHYGGNAETYMNVGQAMGEAMVGLLKGGQ